LGKIFMWQDDTLYGKVFKWLDRACLFDLARTNGIKWGGRLLIVWR